MSGPSPNGSSSNEHDTTPLQELVSYVGRQAKHPSSSSSSGGNHNNNAQQQYQQPPSQDERAAKQVNDRPQQGQRESPNGDDNISKNNIPMERPADLVLETQNPVGTGSSNNQRNDQPPPPQQQQQQQDEQQPPAPNQADDRQQPNQQQGGQRELGQQVQLVQGNDQNFMYLTGEEEEWAMNIREICELEPGLEALSDFWYAHLALVNKDDIETAVKQAKGLQKFCEEFDIIETVAKGRQCVEQFMDAHPGFLLYLGNNPGQVSVLAFDYSKVHGISGRECLRGYYYICHAITTDLAMIRRGHSTMLECADFDARNFGWSGYKQMWDKLFSCYPIAFAQVRLFHAGVLISVIYHLARNFFRPQDRDMVQIGLTSPLGQLSNMYLSPTVEAAKERVLQRVVSGLERRYANDASFTL